jgi:hypothetical protein
LALRGYGNGEIEGIRTDLRLVYITLSLSGIPSPLYLLFLLEGENLFRYISSPSNSLFSFKGEEEGPEGTALIIVTPMPYIP